MGEVRYERGGRVSRVILDKPQKLNALSDDGIEDLRTALYAFNDDDDAWVAILSGSGRAFCSGVDVHQRQALPQEEIARIGGLPRGPHYRDGLFGKVFGQLRMKPVIAAVHGYAFGLGLRLSVSCDLLVASEGTEFQVTEVPRGLEGGDFWTMLADRVGSAFADDVCLTGRRWRAEEPAARGFVTCLASKDKHLEVAQELAEAVLANPPLAVRSIVRTRRARLARLELSGEQLADRSLVFTEDFQESVRAFIEKRPPVYQGR